MIDCPYQVLGVGISQMHGRRRVLSEVVGRLTKATPDHVQIVGPRHYGKTVLLNHLTSVVSNAKPQHYRAVMYWDLGHLTPTSDAEFIRQFVRRLRKSLLPIEPDLASNLDPDEDALDNLQIAVELLESDGQRILVILDGFDRVLRSTNITRNLWDQLRDLGQRSSLRYVTGSRMPLRELCKTDEAQTSDFWTMFNTSPTVVGSFSQEDIEPLCEPIERLGVTVQLSARREIMNWTGGVPLLVAAMMEQICAAVPANSDVDKVLVDKMAEGMLQSRGDLLHELIQDCNLEVRNILSLIESEQLAASEIPSTIREELSKRGFIEVSGARVRFTSRLIKDHVKHESGGFEDLRRQFGEEQHYHENLRTLLELRLAQVRDPDQHLKAAIERMIRELPDCEGTLIPVRRVTDRALELIWNKELPSDLGFPSDWIGEWENAQERYPIDRRVPRDIGPQIGCLMLMTGTRNVRRVSRYVTKPTALLVSHLKSVGDFGQHQEGPLHFSAVGSFCLAAVELCHSLTADLRREVGPAVTNERPK